MIALLNYKDYKKWKTPIINIITEQNLILHITKQRINAYKYKMVVMNLIRTIKIRISI
jgi:hypothetical protein